MSDGASQQAIEFHYDVGSSFYSLWLDPKLSYSCALWDSPGNADPAGAPDFDDDLEAAQARKLDFHARAARASAQARILDVGCGWGSMMLHLIEHYDVGAVTGLTLSTDQADWVAKHQHPAVDVRIEDWRDHQPAAPYDAIVSIGAFEHFVRPELGPAAQRGVYREFFARGWSWLNPGGRLSLQTIGMEDEAGGSGPVAEWLSRQVFPESALPRLTDIVEAAEPHFRILVVRSDAAHYAHTLQLWQRRLEANRVPVTDLVGRDTYRHYLRYLRVCRAMFERGTCTLYRLVLQRRDDPTKLDPVFSPDAA